MKFEKIVFGLLTVSFVFSGNVSGYANYHQAEGIQTLDLNLSREHTLSRGFEIIDGNIYDKYGSLIMEVNDGITQFGTTVSPDFYILYGDEMPQEDVTEINTRATDIFNATASLSQNTTGQQGRRLGAAFSLSGSERRVMVRYGSGTVPGVNFGLNNVTLNRSEGWISNVAAGSAARYFSTVYNAGRPNDSFEVVASGQGGSGNATLLVQKRN